MSRIGQLGFVNTIFKVHHSSLAYNLAPGVLQSENVCTVLLWFLC